MLPTPVLTRGIHTIQLTRGHTERTLWRRTCTLHIERIEWELDFMLWGDAIFILFLNSNNNKKKLHITCWSDCSSQSSRTQSKLPLVLCLTTFAQPSKKGKKHGLYKTVVSFSVDRSRFRCASHQVYASSTPALKYCVIPLNLLPHRVPFIAVDARQKNSENTENVRNTTFLNISLVSFLHLSIRKSRSQSVTVQTGFTGAEVKGWMDECCWFGIKCQWSVTQGEIVCCPFHERTDPQNRCVSWWLLVSMFCTEMPEHADWWLSQFFCICLTDRSYTERSI